MKDFKTIDTPDPHKARMKALLGKYPELKKLYGYDLNTTYVLMAVVVTQTFFAYQFSHAWANWPWYAWLLFTFFIGAPLTHWCAMGIHEASHNLVAPKPWQNNLVSIISNFPFLLPSAMAFTRHHMKHHKFIGDRKRDNDLPSPIEIKVVQNSSILKFLWQGFFILTIAFLRGGIKKPTKWEVINWIFQIAYIVFLAVFMGPKAFLYLALCTLFGFGLHPAAGHYLHEHFILKEGQETYSYYGPLNKITFNVGYHVEHHDTIGIPGSRLPQVRATAPEFYDNLMSSSNWTKVYWNFFTNKAIGTYSRYARDY